jgi:hypothetical protein
MGEGEGAGEGMGVGEGEGDGAGEGMRVGEGAGDDMLHVVVTLRCAPLQQLVLPERTRMSLCLSGEWCCMRTSCIKYI